LQGLSAGPGNATSTNFAYATNGLPYRVMQPDNYQRTNATRYPLVIFLHGTGGRGTNNTSQMGDFGTALSLVNDHNRQAHPSFVIVPQCPGGSTTWVFASVYQKLYGIITNLSTTEKIDTSRIYVTGLSMGGEGTWQLLSIFPSLFAAGVPMSGAAQADILANAPSFAHVPVWIFHATNDGVVGYGWSRNIAATLRSNGGNPIFTTWYGGGHAGTFWSVCYGNQVMKDWMWSQRLGANSNTSPWLEISSPLRQPVLYTNASSLAVSGFASNTNGTAVLSVTWKNHVTGKFGAAVGSNTWSISSIGLTHGSNLLYVQAKGEVWDDPNHWGGEITYSACQVIHRTNALPPDTTPPSVSGAPANFTTNAPFTVTLAVNENSGWWSTNGSAYVSFTTAGVSIPIRSTTALRYYGRDSLGNTGVTNLRTYTLTNVVDDTRAPIVSVSPVGGVYGGPVSVALRVDDDTGYWSTNGGQSWVSFGPSGARVACSNSMRLLYYGKDASGNQSLTQQIEYILVPRVSRLRVMPHARRATLDLITEVEAHTNAGFELCYDWKEESAAEWTPIAPKSLREFQKVLGGGPRTNVWQPGSFEMPRTISFRVRGALGAVFGNEIILSRVDLSGLGSLQDKLATVTLFNHPFRGESDGVVLANLTRDCVARVYSISGRLVANLPAADGQGRTTWSVRDGSGKTMSPGHYLCHVKNAGSEKILVIMVLP
jgi:dienelactone hydrolase